MEKKLEKIEILGLIVLILVSIAVSGMVIETKSSLIKYSFAIMTIIILFSVISTFSRVLKLSTSIRSLKISGFILLLIGAFVIIFVTDFFIFMKSIPYSYWHKVSVYSLPAICIQGGLFNLFKAYILSSNNLRKRENNFLFAGFLVYSTIAISINFFALNDVLETKFQIEISKWTVLVVLIISLIFYLRDKIFIKR